jgi:hypothetical protein
MAKKKKDFDLEIDINSKDMQDFFVEMKKKKERIPSAIKEINDVLRKYDVLKGKNHYDIDLPVVLGKILASVRGDDTLDLPSFHIERTIDVVLGEKVNLYVPLLNKIYKKLLDIDEGRHEWNDLDNHTTIIKQKDKSKKVMLFENQNFQFITIHDTKTKKLHLRQVWEELPEYDDRDEYFDEDYYIKNQGMFTDYKGKFDYYYVNRPSIAWYQKKGFELEYHSDISEKLENDKDSSYRAYADCRDKGYIATLDIGLNYSLSDKLEIDRGIGTYNKLYVALMDISGTAYDLNIIKGR